MLKYANVFSDLQIHQEIHPPLAHPPREGTGLRAEVTEAEVAATVPQGTVNPTLPPISHLPGLSISQTSFSIPPMNRNRGVLLAQDLLLPEMSSLSVSLEALRDVAALASLLVVPDRVHELFC